MPKPASLAHELVCKLIVVILGADVIDFVYVGNCRVIKSNAALSLQFLAGVGAKGTAERDANGRSSLSFSEGRKVSILSHDFQVQKAE